MTAPAEPAAPQLVEPKQYDWDETPEQAAREDNRWWDVDRCYEADEE